MEIPHRPPRTAGFWRRPVVRRRTFQLLVLVCIGSALLWLLYNTQVNMDLRGIHGGWDFLFDRAGFDIGESLLAFDSAEPYWKAFLVGFGNTLRVALPGILLTTVLGTLIGVGRFSRSALMRGACSGYVEVFRNLPLLLQLLMWYLLFTETLPDATAPVTLGPLYLSKGGLQFPVPVWTAGSALLQIDYPRQGLFAPEGGAALTPEYLALLLGLTLYTAAFVAEVVRGGILAVPPGQTEAALALGLRRSQILRRVTLPQALRVMIPPLTNQYLNLSKNASLAVVIGYPDLVSVANTAINQTGRAVECIAIIMLVYLVTSLLTALGMHRFHLRTAIRER